MFLAELHPIMVTKLLRRQNEMDWCAACGPQAACLILRSHKRSNADLSSKSVKLLRHLAEPLFI